MSGPICAFIGAKTASCAACALLLATSAVSITFWPITDGKTAGRCAAARDFRDGLRHAASSCPCWKLHALRRLDPPAAGIAAVASSISPARLLPTRAQRDDAIRHGAGFGRSAPRAPCVVGREPRRAWRRNR